MKGDHARYWVGSVAGLLFLVSIVLLVGAFMSRTTTVEPMVASNASTSSDSTRGSEAVPTEPPQQVPSMSVEPSPELPQTVRVPILAYHNVRPIRPTDTPEQISYNVPPEAFAAHLDILTQHGFTSIMTDDLVAHLTEGESLPERPIIITFDDGLKSQYTIAFPILVEYGFVAEFYVYPNAVGADERFVTWDELREMVDAGMRIQSHSRSHPYLTREQTPESLVREIVGSKEVIEDQLGTSVTSFAYPFGLYDDDVLQVVREAGYTSALTIDHGTMHDRTSLLTLKRHIATRDPTNFLYLVNKR